LFNPDMKNGYFGHDRIQTGFTDAISEVKEQGRYEVEQEFPNGGKTMKWIVERPFVAGQPSKPIFEYVKIYKPFTAEEKFFEQNEETINKLQESLDYLSATDQSAFRFLEGDISESEFDPIRNKRKEVRLEINRLQSILDEKRTRGDILSD